MAYGLVHDHFRKGVHVAGRFGAMAQASQGGEGCQDSGSFKLTHYRIRGNPSGLGGANARPRVKFVPPVVRRSHVGRGASLLAVGIVPRSIIVLVGYRSRILAFTGAILVGTATVLFGLSLDPQGCSGLAYLVDESFCPPRFEILWFQLSEMEVLVWSPILGASMGTLLGLLVDRLSRGLWPAPKTHRGIGTVVAMSLLALVSCTGPEVHSKRPSSNAPFARYFFSASGIQGVLEVSKSPPSVCYSTQSQPARPISIVPESLGLADRSPRVESGATASFAPKDNDFCGTVSPALAAGLLANSSGYLVRWRPSPDGPTASSSITPVWGLAQP